MDKGYAALIAQVVPVVLLAVVVELRELHRVWLDTISDRSKPTNVTGGQRQRRPEEGPSPAHLPSPLPMIIVGLVLVSYLAVVEGAALLGAFGKASDLIEQLLSPGVVVFSVVGGLVLIAAFSTVALTHRYQQLGVISNRSRAVVQWVIRAVVVAALLVSAALAVE